jgi:two-component system sensor histidine kinase DesK
MTLAAATPGDPAIRRATTLVTMILCLLMIAFAGFAATHGPSEAVMVLAMSILPLLYIFPATRPFWLRHRYPLLAVQAVLTWVPFALFGLNWVQGPSGWLAGLVLLIVPSPASWLLAAALAVIEETVWVGIVGLPFPAPAAASWVIIAFVMDALILFGLARLANLIAAVHAARDELAEAALNAERLRATDSLRAAIGDPLTEAATRAAAALRSIDRNTRQAREYVTETAVAARQALAEVREVTSIYRDAARPEAAPTPVPVTMAPRLAQGILVTVLCGLMIMDVLDVAVNVNNVNGGSFGPGVVAWTAVDAAALTVLQLRHSWPSPGARRPRGWPVTLALQALLTYAMFPVTGWRPLITCGFLAGTALLLLPARLGWIAFAAVTASVPVLWAVKPVPTATSVEWVGAMFFLTTVAVVFGLLVYGLTRLAWLAVQLENLRGELARRAVLGERLRVARDTHDLLGLGLSAIAMRADLVVRLMDRADTRAAGELAELARICATARADIRLVTGEGRELPLDAEITAARDVLASAGIDVRADVCLDLDRGFGAALVPVIREAVTNILKHSDARHCVLSMTAEDGQLRLLISNDGVGGDPPLAEVGRTGHGLDNLADRVESVGGRLVAGSDASWFRLVAEIPL